MTTKTFKIDGMGCDGCANSLTNVLNAHESINQAKVTFSDKTAEIETSLDDNFIKKMVEEAGFQISEQ